MPRYTFFSFCYEDVKNFKVNVVRNSWLINHDSNTFVDGSIWESEKLKKANDIKDLIDYGMQKTSVTAVLIGQETAHRRFVKYEIIKSFERGNGILGIHINRIRGRDQAISARGLNPLDRLGFDISKDGRKITFWELINGRWLSFKDLPEINNKKSNTLHFEDGWFSNQFGKFYRFSDKFNTYCWTNGNGHKKFAQWIESSAIQAGR